MNLQERAKATSFRRKMRVRNRIRSARTFRPRLSVFKTAKHIYVQLIDDRAGKTLAAASTLDKDVRAAHKNGGNISAAKAVGSLIAKRVSAAGVKEIAFDRSGFMYHGRVKALADAAREGGLSF
jgi:large subunit ribosomal protein L18